MLKYIACNFTSSTFKKEMNMKVQFGGLYLTGSPEDVQLAVEILSEYTSRNALPILPGSLDSQAKGVAETTVIWPELGAVLFTISTDNPDDGDVLLDVVSV